MSPSLRSSGPARVACPAVPPSALTLRAPARTALRTHSARATSSSQASRNAASKLSPAPVVSTASTALAGHLDPLSVRCDGEAAERAVLHDHDGPRAASSAAATYGSCVLAERETSARLGSSTSISGSSVLDPAPAAGGSSLVSSDVVRPQRVRREQHSGHRPRPARAAGTASRRARGLTPAPASRRERPSDLVRGQGSGSRRGG